MQTVQIFLWPSFVTSSQNCAQSPLFFSNAKVKVRTSLAFHDSLGTVASSRAQGHQKLCRNEQQLEAERLENEA